MKRQIVTLEVVYDDSADGFKEVLRPSDWDWTAMVGDTIRVTDSGPVEEIE